MPECDTNYMPWMFSTFCYILAIILLIAAIASAAWYAVKCEDYVKKHGSHRLEIPTWLFMASIALGILAIVQQGYENGHVADLITRGMKKTY